jgi:hypothetical protein
MFAIFLLALFISGHALSSSPNAYNISGFGTDADFTVHTTVSVSSLDTFRAAITSYRKIMFEPDTGKLELNTPIKIISITHLII